MFFIGGICDGTKKLTDEVYMTYTYFSFFFIPIFKWNKRYFVRTKGAQFDLELSKELGRQIERGENADMFNFSQMSQVMGMKSLADRFFSNHPKLLPFISAVAAGSIKEGTVIELSVKEEDGKEYVTNIKLTADDMLCLEKFKNMRQGQ